MLNNLDFDGHFDYTPYVDLDKAGNRRWNEFMSGNFSWRHVVSWSTFISSAMILFKFFLDRHIWGRCNNRRLNVLRYPSGCRQNHSLSGHWKCRVPPFVPLNQECPQHCLVCALKCCGPDWVPCHSQKYVNLLTRTDSSSYLATF